MFCTKCGANVEDGVKFCTECGENLLLTTSQQSQPDLQQQASYQQTPSQPVYQQQPVYQAAYQPAMNMAPKRKRHVGLYVMLSILIILAAIIVYILGSLSFFKPKDLGIKYTQADFNGVIQKLGIHINADLGSNQTYDNAPILAGSMTSKGDSTITKENFENGLNYQDFNWEFSNYVQKSVTLTPEEVTAFFNEIAPTFWWFDKTQVKIDGNGKIITSSQADIKKIKEDLYSDVANNIPIPLPDKVNIYTEGDFSITDNKINMVPDVIKAGPLSVPEQYLAGDNLDIFSSFLERFYTVIPGLQINNAGIKDGEFVFDGMIPTEVKVTPKN